MFIGHSLPYYDTRSRSEFQSAYSGKEVTVIDPPEQALETQLLIRLGHSDRVAHSYSYGVAGPAFVSTFQPFDNLACIGPGEGESHLVILGHAKDAIAGARQDNLGFVGG